MSVLRNCKEHHLLSVTVAVVFALLACWGESHASHVSTAQSTVTDVRDGDTVVIDRRRCGRMWLHGGIVEIDGIDAPELDQPGGIEARDFLAALVKGREVTITEVMLQGRSQGGRVFIRQPETGKSQSVNMLMLEKGHAWFKKGRPSYVKVGTAETMSAAQMKAKEDHLGLWKAAEPVPPWEWRQGKRQVHTTEITNTIPVTGSSRENITTTPPREEELSPSEGVGATRKEATDGRSQPYHLLVAAGAGLIVVVGLLVLLAKRMNQ